MADNQKITRIVLRHDTSENWASVNPVLLKGELAFELTEDGSVKMKVGNGYTPWNGLAPLSTESTGGSTGDGASSAEVEGLKKRVANWESELTNQAKKFDSIDELLEAHAASIATIQEELVAFAANDDQLFAAITALTVEVNTLKENVVNNEAIDALNARADSLEAKSMALEAADSEL